jgi:hypothetical protein
MNEMQRSFGWAIWLAASLILSGCASPSPVPCPPVQTVYPELPKVEIPPEGYFIRELQKWILEVSDDWQSGPTG